MPPKRKGGSPGKAAANTTGAEMRPGGDSDGWAQAKENQVRIVELFLADAQTDAELKKQAGTTTWGDVPESVACSEYFFGHYATYLAQTYIIPPKVRNAGKKLKLKTALGLWSGLINQLQTMYATSDRKETQVCAAPRCAELRKRSARPTRTPQLPLPPCSRLNPRSRRRTSSSAWRRTIRRPRCG